MSDSDEAPAPADPPRPAKASSTAMIVRESDKMRTGTDAAVLDISMSSLLLSTRGPFAVDEQIKLRLRNIVQRFEKEARGVVRKVDVNADGSITLTLELLTRLSALEVSLLKMGIPTGEAGSGSKWV
jgi:DNA phosphorothioation-dependent restriction protein DptG